MARPLKIVHVIGLAHGGAGAHVLGLAAGCDPDRFETTVVMAKGSPLAAQFRAAKIRTLELGLDHGGNPVWNAAAFGRLTHFLRRERFDLVHTHTSVAGALGRTAAWRAGGSLAVHTLHSFASHAQAPWWRRRPGLAVERWLDASTDHYVAPTRFMLEQGVRRGIFESDKATVIPNGVDLARIERAARQDAAPLRTKLRLAKDAPLVGFAGRLEEAKGCDQLLYAAADVVKAEPTARFIIAGDGRWKARLERLADSLDLGPAVYFLGWESNVAAVLDQVDLVAVPSRWESFGLAAAEAMALRKPVVATAVDGLPEVVEDGVTGRLVPPADPIALATGILELIRNPGLRTRMGEQGRKRVEKRFTLASMIEAHHDLYDRLLGRGQVQGGELRRAA
ncbi:MAG: glycosyltransferase family 4 protein [Pirellulales bacterium]